MHFSIFSAFSDFRFQPQLRSLPHLSFHPTSCTPFRLFFLLKGGNLSCNLFDWLLNFLFSRLTISFFKYIFIGSWVCWIRLDFDATNATGAVWWASPEGDIPFAGMNRAACDNTKCPIEKSVKNTYAYSLPIAKKYPLVCMTFIFVFVLLMDWPFKWGSFLIIYFYSIRSLLLFDTFSNHSTSNGSYKMVA